MEKEILISAGLTVRESEAYLALLELQDASVAEISERTKENRTHVYDTLNSLITQGLVSYVIKNGKKYFRPSNPEKIIEILKEKENLVKEALPMLKELYKPKSKKPVIEIFEGKEGIKTVLQDILKENKEWLCLGSTGKSEELVPFFLSHFHKQRIKQKLPLKVIYNEDGFGRKRGEEVSKQKYSQIRYMQKTSPTTTYVYGEKTIIIHWEKDKLFAVMIQDKEIADSYRSYFNEIWKIAKK